MDNAPPQRTCENRADEHRANPIRATWVVMMVAIFHCATKNKEQYLLTIYRQMCYEFFQIITNIHNKTKVIFNCKFRSKSPEILL